MGKPFHPQWIPLVLEELGLEGYRMFALRPMPEYKYWEYTGKALNL